MFDILVWVSLFLLAVAGASFTVAYRLEKAPQPGRPRAYSAAICILLASSTALFATGPISLIPNFRAQEAHVAGVRSVSGDGSTSAISLFDRTLPPKPEGAGDGAWYSLPGLLPPAGQPVAVERIVLPSQRCGIVVVAEVYLVAVGDDAETNKATVDAGGLSSFITQQLDLL